MPFETWPSCPRGDAFSVKTTPAPIPDHKKLGVATGPLRRQRGMGLSMTGLLEVPMARNEVSPARA